MVTMLIAPSDIVIQGVENVTSVIDGDVFYAADGESALVIHEESGLGAGTYIVAIDSQGNTSSLKGDEDGWQTGWEA